MLQARTTRILQRACKGDQGALAELVTLVYEELRRIAASYIRGQRPGHTLQPTALVHEAYLRLVNQGEVEWRDKAHFLAVAAKAMRQILVDHARRKRAKKRGGEPLRVTLDPSRLATRDRNIDVLALDEVLERLGRLEERQARVVELRFFGGLTIEETAEAIGISPKTVEADWYGARAWLRRELAKE